MQVLESELGLFCVNKNAFQTKMRIYFCRRVFSNIMSQIKNFSNTKGVKDEKHKSLLEKNEEKKHATHAGFKISEDLIEQEAYILWETGFSSDSLSNWFEAERRISESLKNKRV